MTELTNRSLLMKWWTMSPWELNNFSTTCQKHLYTFSQFGGVIAKLFPWKSMSIGNRQSILTCYIWTFVLHYTQFKTLTKLINMSLLLKWKTTSPWELYNFSATCQKHRYTFSWFVGVVANLFPWKSMNIGNR